jgi:hypothetical protein
VKAADRKALETLRAELMVAAAREHNAKPAKEADTEDGKSTDYKGGVQCPAS